MGWRCPYFKTRHLTTKDFLKDRDLSQASSKHYKRNQRAVLDPHYHGSLLSHWTNFPSKYNIQAHKTFKPPVFVK